MRRDFRTFESLAKEVETRSRVVDFLQNHGFTSITEESEVSGTAIMQTIQATNVSGEKISMAVRLCWRERERKSSHRYSAFQLLHKIKDNDAEGSVEAKIALELGRGKTHWLVVERDDDGITGAMLIPLNEMPAIWRHQRQVYDHLLQTKQLGRRRTNPALNGNSPTLYLRDDRAPSVAEHLAVYPLVLRYEGGFAPKPINDDSLDDLSGENYHLLGSDNPKRSLRVVSGVKRDPKVRAKVMELAKCRCELCRLKRSFAGFFDVHHIFGVEVSDRVENCVALCPNCHREAHFSPMHETINAQLLHIAKQRCS